jgi:hypothetical protein
MKNRKYWKKLKLQKKKLGLKIMRPNPGQTLSVIGFGVMGYRKMMRKEIYFLLPI